ncbi:hypothetical protein [Microcoleus sp. Aus8_D4]
MLEILGSYIKLAVDIERGIQTRWWRTSRRLRSFVVGKREQAGRYLGSRLVSADARSRL